MKLLLNEQALVTYRVKLLGAIQVDVSDSAPFAKPFGNHSSVHFRVCYVERQLGGGNHTALLLKLENWNK